MMTRLNRTRQNPIVVLLVDNDLDFLATRAESVEKAGYQVLQAGSLEKARAYLLNERVHVVVTDVRMVDNNDTRDKTGLALAKDGQFQAIPKIVLTGFPAFQDTRDVMASQMTPSFNGERLAPAINYLEKDEGPAAMIAAITQAVEQHVRINWGLSIRWPKQLSFTQLVQQFESGLPPSLLLSRSLIVEDLFRRLFGSEAQITIDELLISCPTYVVLRLFAFGQDGRENGYIVTCGLEPAVRGMVQRYEAAALSHFGGTSLDEGRRAETVHYAAAAHRFLGPNLAELTPLRQYQRQYPPEAVETAINYLYQKKLRLWYEKGANYPEKSLTEHYSEWLDEHRLSRDADEFPEQIQSLCQQLMNSGLGHCSLDAESFTYHLQDKQFIQLPNPVTLLEQGALKKVSQVRWGLTHGQVNLDTVLVDPESRCWLIDFSQVGQAPLLQDFVSLEMALKQTYLENYDLSRCCQLEQRLAGLTTLTEKINTDELPETLVQLLRQIQRIRHLAAAFTDCSWLAYQVGLFFQALAHLSQYQPTVHYLRREMLGYGQALMAAAFLGTALSQNQPAPQPQPQEAAGQALWLDTANRTLWVQGKPHRLPPMEYRVMAYLYDRADQLCYKQAIIQEGLKEPYDAYDREQSRLTTLISRLRRRIEPDKNKPQFLHTIHSYGYKLTLNPIE
ncbi:MAG: DNA-binding response regulator [Anaerolineae bacterium]|nr:DNA-binding response regulator [Anaerolineae bacterium]